MDDGRRRPVGRGMAAMLIAGQCTRHGVWRSRRDGGRGRPCSRRGHGPCGDAPPIFFSILWKRKRAVHGPKEKTALVATLHVCAKLLYGGRRIGASVDLARPSGTLGPSARSILPSRGGWCPGRRVARTHLTSFSFRAFRFATRCPGGRRSCCIPMLRLSSTTGQRQRKEKLDVSLTSPGQKIPQGQRVSVPDCRKGQPTFPRRRQEVCAGADRPAEAFFLFGPCTARFSFGKTKREMGGALPSYQHS